MISSNENKISICTKIVVNRVCISVKDSGVARLFKGGDDFFFISKPKAILNHFSV